MKKILFILLSFMVIRSTAQNVIASKNANTIANSFKNINFSDTQIYTSGLISGIIDRQFWAIQKSELDDATKLKELNTSVDIILDSVKKNEKLYNDLTKYLFQYFEKYSLFEASEYIALKALNQKEVTLNISLVNKLESYRKMKVGNIAPNFELVGDVLKNGLLVKKTIRLNGINTKYKLVIFGGSWCNQCRSEMIQLLPRYNNWKTKGLEVVFVSLDTDKKEFENFTTPFPFYSACDYKKWDTQAAKDYYVSSSPTIFLLDRNNKIILRPPTVSSLDSWLESMDFK